MKKRTIIVVGLVIVAIVAAAIFLKPADTAPSYVTEPVTKGNIELVVSASGNVNPELLYTVNPRIASRYTEINVKTGDIVTKGQQLAKLDATDLNNAVKTAEYNFNAAVYARDQLKNAPVVDDYSVKRAQQQINTASIAVQSAKNNLANATLTSPIDGKVLAVNVKLDEYGSMTGVTPAFVVGDTKPLQAYLNVNEIDVDQVEPGQVVKLNFDALDKTVAGKVVYLDEYGTNTAGIIYYEVRTDISDAAGLKPNMSVNADIVIASKNDVLTIPSAAIQRKEGKTMVQVLVKAQDGTAKAEVKEVQTGIDNNSVVEVVSGLTEGELVIVSSNEADAVNPFNFGSSN